MLDINIMREVNLAGIDLNLLVALEALLAERSVTRAADRVGLSQPAMSRALGRLRALFGDRLFVRTAHGLAATPRATALAEPLGRALAGVRGLLVPDGFDPARFHGRMRLTCPDIQSLEMLPPLMDRLRRQAPGLDVEVVPMRGTGLDMLLTGEVELATGRFPEPRPGLYGQVVYRSGFACVVRADHPAVTEGLTLEQYVDLPHILVTVTGRGPSAVDEALAERGLTRRVALRVPHFIAAPLIVARTDMVLTLPRGLARRMAALAPLVVLEPPLPLEGFDVGLAWHERMQDDPAHAWFRREVAAALKAGADA